MTHDSRDTTPFEVGMFIGELVGRRLFGYERACPACRKVTPHQTRADETDAGRQIELEVCSDCGRVQKISAL